MAHDESKETFNVKYRLNLYAVCTKFVKLLLLLLLPPPPPTTASTSTTPPPSH